MNVHYSRTCPLHLAHVCAPADTHTQHPCTHTCSHTQAHAVLFRSQFYSFFPHVYSCLFFFCFRPCCEACGILVPQPGIEPVSPAMEAQGPNHWTTREAPYLCLFSIFSCPFPSLSQGIFSSSICLSPFLFSLPQFWFSVFCFVFTRHQLCYTQSRGGQFNASHNGPRA